MYTTLKSCLISRNRHIEIPYLEAEVREIETGKTANTLAIRVIASAVAYQRIWEVINYLEYFNKD